MFGLTINKVLPLIALFILSKAVPEKKAWEDNLDQRENLKQKRLVSGTRLSALVLALPLMTLSRWLFSLAFSCKRRVLAFSGMTLSSDQPESQGHSDV